MWEYSETTEQGIWLEIRYRGDCDGQRFEQWEMLSNLGNVPSADRDDITREEKLYEGIRTIRVMRSIG